MDRQQHVLVIIDQPPYGSSSALESTNTLLAACAFDQPLSLLVLGDGLLQFLTQQQPETQQLKDTAAMLSALPMYGLEAIQVLDEDMNKHGLTAEDLLMPINILSNEKLRTLIQQADQVITF